MSDAGFFVGLALVYGVASLLSRLGQRAHDASVRLRAWREVAEQSGLTDLASGSGPSLTARHGPLVVRFSDSTTVEIRDPDHPIPMGSHSSISADLVETGSATFDAELRLSGSPSALLALLDATTRGRLMRVATDAAVRVSDGALFATRDDADDGRTRISPRLVEAAVEAVQRLTAPVELPQRLVDNAAHDPELLVRLQNLRELTSRFADHPLTRQAIETAAREVSPELRLHAAVQQGKEGVPLLRAIIDDATTPDDCAARTAAVLERHLEIPAMQALLQAAVAAQRPETTVRFMHALARRDPSSAGPVVERILLGTTGTPAMAACALLARLRGPMAEGPLVQALTRDTPVATAAARALSGIGSAASVPALHAAERAGDDSLREAASQAIADIRARLPGGGTGHLSLTTPDAGQVSLAEEKGHVSIAPPPTRGQP